MRAIRGNVDTRIEKWRQLGVPGAVILAQAGLDRLGDRLEARRSGGLPIHPVPHRSAPAGARPGHPGGGDQSGQRGGGAVPGVAARGLGTRGARRAARGGGLRRRLHPAAGRLGAVADEGGELRLSALLATPDGARVARGEGRAADPEAAADACIEALRADGAETVMEEIAALSTAAAAK